MARAEDSSGELILVKLGGSLITDKSSSHIARDDALSTIAGELAEAIKYAALRGESPLRMIIGHGSGSFGHTVAAKYGFSTAVEHRHHLDGAAATQDSAGQLHRRVIRSLLDVGLVPFSIAPSSCFMAESGVAIPQTVEPLEKALELGMIPVIFGDVVLDRVRGACVLSTEKVFLGLAGENGIKSYRILRSIWLGVTGGVYDGEGKIIQKIDRKSFSKVVPSIGASAGTDVTGGMRHRVEAALDLADLGVSSMIVDGNQLGILRDFLAAKSVNGTFIEDVYKP